MHDDYYYYYYYYMIWVEKPEKRDPLEEPGVYGTIILKRIFRKRGRGVEWIDLAQNADSRRALVNVAMKLRVP
jgi:hypothetical protein